MSHMWCDTFFLQCKTKETSTYAAYAQTEGSLWTASVSPPIPLLLIFSRPRVLPLHPFVLIHWGMGHTDRCSVHNKRTTGNFAFEGLNMHERPKWVRARGMSLCDRLFNPNIGEQMHPLPQSNRWKCVSNGAWWAPHSLPLPSVLRTAGRQTFHLLSFQRKTKECGTPPTHTCPPPHMIATKKVSIQLEADHISARLAKPETFLADESLRESEKQGLVSAPLKSGLVNKNVDISVVEYEVNAQSAKLIAPIGNLRMSLIIVERTGSILSHYLSSLLQISPVTLVTTTIITLEKLN